VYNGSGTPAFGVNTMQPLQGQHRTDFLSFVGNLQPMQGTPSYWMFSQADAYLRAPLSVNGPWASIPGTQATPYLACRRNYHIMMTDGRWNLAYSSPPVTDNGTTAFILGDGTTSYGATAQTRIYRDSDPGGNANDVGTLADWAFYSWAKPLQATTSLTQLQPDNTAVKPSPDYTSAPLTETIGGVALQKFWNPKYDPATWPHLVTYTIGFSNDAVQWPGNGMPASCNSAAACPQVSPYYSYATSAVNQIQPPTQQVPFGYDGDFPSLVSGTKLWPDLQGPSNELNHSLDLWHAALNGRGNFFAVTQPQDLENAFRQIIQAINVANEPSVSSMAASGFNASRTAVGTFIAGYDPTNAWAGYVKSMLIQPNGTTGDNPAWGGQTTAQKLDSRTPYSATSRVVLAWSNKWAGSNVTGGAPFAFSNFSPEQQAMLNSGGGGDDRVQYLRGNRDKEVQKSGTLRNRTSIQGDIVNSSVWYTGAPANLYSMVGYSNFVSSKGSRPPMIYVGGNDGMLHGFSAADGSEKIAYVPRGVVPTLSQLTDPGYNHIYYVDGSPMTGDANFNGGGNDSAYAVTLGGGAGSSDWRTVLVGTLGAGGRGYFVLDVTNPPSFSESNANSLVLTDHTRGNAETQATTCPNPMSGGSAALAACNAAWIVDNDMGNITASPVLDDVDGLRSTQIALMNNNKWAAVLGNGYNSPNQRPVLLIQYLDGTAMTLKAIPVTGAAYASDNGLAAPRLVDINGDGRVDVAYAGDNQGNLWKFDLTSSNDSDWGVAFGGQPLFTATGPASLGGGRNLAQPISAPPTVRANNRKMDTGNLANPQAPVGGMMVAFGTGRNVSVDDPASTAVQTLYSVLDNTRYTTIDTGLGQRLQVAAAHGSVGDPDYVPAPAPLGTGVAAANLAQQTITSPGSTYSTVTANDDLNPSTWLGRNGWYLDFSATGERLLQSIQFYDGTNILSLYSQVPPKSNADTTPGAESCESAGVASGSMYLTLVNIMDGKMSPIPLVDTNGDGRYTDEDGLVGHMQVDYGPHTQTAIGDHILDSTPNKIPKCPGDPSCLNRPPIQSLLPSWRQWQ